MAKQDKKLVLALLAAVGVFGATQLLVVRANFADAAKARDEANTQRQEWDKYFKPAEKSASEKWSARPDAEKALKESNVKLAQQFTELRKMELGSADQLHAFSEAAAGSGDHKSYMNKLLIQLAAKAKEFGVAVPSDMGFNEKVLEDPVSLNLLRMAILDRLLAACKEAAVPQLASIRFEQPRPIANDDGSDSGQPDPRRRPAKNSKDAKDAPPEPSADKLVQFPLRILISVPERNMGQLLCELQRPSDNTHGFFMIRGFHVAVRTADTGRFDASLALSALLNEKTLATLGVQVKAPDERRNSFRDYDYSRDY